MSSTGWGAGPAIPGPIAARAPRQRTCLLGKLVYSDGSFWTDKFFTLDCSINDLSEGGAKVTIAKHQLLPASLYLIIIKHSVAHRAEMAWMKYPSRGLRFRETYKLEEPMPGGMKFLQNVWTALYPRNSCIQHDIR
jgi:hypothetical protein